MDEFVITMLQLRKDSFANSTKNFKLIRNVILQESNIYLVSLMDFMIQFTTKNYNQNNKKTHQW